MENAICLRHCEGVALPWEERLCEALFVGVSCVCCLRFGGETTITEVVVRHIGYASIDVEERAVSPDKLVSVHFVSA